MKYEKIADYSNTHIVAYIGMVSDSTVLSRLKTIIAEETGVSAADISEEILSNMAPSANAPPSVERTPEEITVNKRGWIEDTENKRINIYADYGSIVFVDGVAVTEKNKRVLNSNGVQIENVWELDSTGRKMYALYDGEYELSSAGPVRIEYMDNGYFNHVIEYDSGAKVVSIRVGDFTEKNVTCTAKKEQAKNTVEMLPSHVYSSEELMELNQD